MSNTKQDYEVAREEANEFYASLGLQCDISKPSAHVSKDWQAIAYSLTYKKGRNALTTSYKLGLGHVKLDNVTIQGESRVYIGKKSPFDHQIGFSSEEVSMLRILKRNAYAQFTNKELQTKLFVKLANVNKLQPSPVEVLCCVASEALEATENTFENWCANFGYDTDSRKAEDTYNQCRAPYPHLLALVGIDNLRKLAEYQYRF